MDTKALIESAVLDLHQAGCWAGRESAVQLARQFQLAGTSDVLRIAADVLARQLTSAD